MKHFSFVFLFLTIHITNSTAQSLVCKIDLSADQVISGHVLQGIANFKNYWIVSQTSNDKFIVLSVLNNKCKEIWHKKIDYQTHGQDLSIVKRNNDYYLYTSGKYWKGVSEFKIIFDKSNIKDIIFIKNYKLNIGKNTPAISKNGRYIVSISYKHVHIFNLTDIDSNVHIRPLVTFILNDTQRKNNQWIQGIAMKNEYIYVLTGNNKINNNKYLVVYDVFGNAIIEKKILAGKDFAKAEGNKWELEGLSIKNSTLYATVMTGLKGKNIKRLYKILDCIDE